MPQTLEKLKGHFASGLLVRHSFRPFVCPFKILSGFSTFVELCPFKRVIMKFCNQKISKTITARSFKLRQLIENNE